MGKSALATLGDNVVRLRTERGLTREQLAVHARVGSRTIASIEAGEANPNFATLVAISEILQVAVSDLTAEPTEMAS
jgi:transcriptional regulator with XRE-family HTH domain